MFRKDYKQPIIPLFGLLLVTSFILLICREYLNLIDLSSIYEDRSEGLSANYSLEYSIRGKKLPEAIIVGSRKSGTRALLKFLEVNQGVSSAHNEIHFFDKPDNYKLGLDWYRDQMPNSDTGSLTIEKSPAYFVTKGVPEKIKSMNPNIKLILVVRDPVKRLISDFSQLIANRIKSHDEALESRSHNSSAQERSSNYTDGTYWTKAKGEFEMYVLRKDGGIDDRRPAVKTGMYSIHLERWLHHFNLSQIHVVDGEALITNPFEELQKIERFLSIDPYIRPEHFVYNPQKGFFCVAPMVLPKGDQLDGSTNMTLSCLSKSKGRRHVQVDEELIGKLSKFYEPYNEYLYSMIGKKFNWGLS